MVTVTKRQHRKAKRIKARAWDTCALEVREMKRKRGKETKRKQPGRWRTPGSLAVVK